MSYSVSRGNGVRMTKKNIGVLRVELVAPDKVLRKLHELTFETGRQAIAYFNNHPDFKYSKANFRHFQSIVKDEDFLLLYKVDGAFTYLITCGDVEIEVEVEDAQFTTPMQR